MTGSVGILSFGAYIPYNRLDRSEIAEVMGSGGGRGQRSIASYDEDTTTMGTEAARIAWRDVPDIPLDSLWFSTAWPAYMEKTNAAAIHAALRLPSEVVAADFGGAARSGIAALAAALRAGTTSNTMVAVSDIRVGLPTGKDESEGGDGAAAMVVGTSSEAAPVVAECLAIASATEEFTDRWRGSAEVAAKQWEERFAESMYLPLADRVWKQALEQASLAEEDIDVAIVTGTHSRSVRQVSSRLKVRHIADSLASSVGNTGTAHFMVLLAQQLELAAPGQTIAVVSLIDGVDALIFKTTPALASHACSRPIASQIQAGSLLRYGKYLQWRELLEVQPPNRLEPSRPSASAAARNIDWKFGFVGSKGRPSQTIHLPPARVSISEQDPPDAMELVAMADVLATVVTYTVDRLVYSVSPPVVFAIVDFEGGGRLPVELTDVAPQDVEVGMKVEMTFRRLFTADGIHNYFWKARPARS